MMAFRDMDVGPQPPSTTAWESHIWRHSGPVLETPMFSWMMEDIYVELMNYEMEVTNILETKVYELTDEEKVPVIKHWLDQEGLQFIKMFPHEKHKNCKTAKGLFSILSNKFKLQCNRILLSLQYQKLHRKNNESGWEWMGKLCTKLADCYLKSMIDSNRTIYT